MKYDSARHRRRSIRLKGYDYKAPGAYFITICTHQRERLFGEVVDGEMQLNRLGERVHACWLQLPNHFSRLQLDAYVVMPNHIHGILMLTDPSDGDCRGDAFDHKFSGLTKTCFPNASPLRDSCNDHGDRPNGTRPGSISAIVQNFKSISTRRINQIRHTPGTPIWQRNFYEHVVRNNTSMQVIRRYIQNNPASWKNDSLHS
ncbi:MAG: transposase [Cyanobacteria bacterium P01_E01_bin.6]